MPEIIEVEITKQKLTPALVGRRILDFKSDWPYGLTSEFGSIAKTAGDIKGRQVQSLDRRGKVILINLSGNRRIVVHQRMSGHLAIVPPGGTIARLGGAEGVKHARFVFDLSGGKKLILFDPRKFGTVWYGTPTFIGNISYMKKLGLDALAINRDELAALIKHSKEGLKAFLLRQDKIAGLGNIMADEILWGARLFPKRVVNTLSGQEIEILHKALKRTLAASLRRGGTSMRDWHHPDGITGTNQKHFKIYKQKSCPGCGAAIKRQTVVGRGTYACNFCQK